MHQGCLVALHMGLLLPRWFRTAWHLSVILASQHGPFPGHNVLSSWEPFLCPLHAPVSFMCCSQEPGLHEAGEITKGFHPLGPGTFTHSRAVVSQKKTFVVAQGW